MMNSPEVRALLFDVFGTVVDWREGVIWAGKDLGRKKSLDVDWPRFADEWRSRYKPSMDRVRSGELPWTKLDDLHRASLEELHSELGITGLTEEEKDHLNRAWHRLDPWPDSVPGLLRLKEHYTIAPLSNGNVSLLTEMSKRAGLPWDLILSAEIPRHYKPDREAYLTPVELLDLHPGQVMMVAAHTDDLHAASSFGLRTAYVHRPQEFGPAGENKPLPTELPFDAAAGDLLELADRLGA